MARPDNRQNLRYREAAMAGKVLRLNLVEFWNGIELSAGPIRTMDVQGAAVIDHSLQCIS
jgi:hypothetical protein